LLLRYIINDLGSTSLKLILKICVIVELVVFTDEWIYYRSHFYYISSQKKNWYDSRRYCTDRRADLIIINNRDEHFIMWLSHHHLHICHCIIRYKTHFIKQVGVSKWLHKCVIVSFFQNFFKKMSCGAHVWIGLTDRHSEGRWKWVDGSNLGFRSWGVTEPNSIGGNEDCAVTHKFGWADFPCHRAYQWICERNSLK
ncbi:C-type lectin domain family 10 member A-like, partial [Garra rufa]|uniref:C-type lectin domain family 10 member A-like n=1 Tax=Garra rufa TaxID=137080 RepID=UPI003CCE6E36